MCYLNLEMCDIANVLLETLLELAMLRKHIIIQRDIVSDNILLNAGISLFLYAKNQESRTLSVWMLLKIKSYLINLHSLTY